LKKKEDRNKKNLPELLRTSSKVSEKKKKFYERKKKMMKEPQRCQSAVPANPKGGILTSSVDFVKTKVLFHNFQQKKEKENQNESKKQIRPAKS